MEYTKEYFEQKIKERKEQLYENLHIEYVVTNHNRNYIEDKIMTIFNDISKQIEEQTEKKASSIVESEFAYVLDSYVPKDLQKYLLYFLDKYQELSYSRGMYRRSVRTKAVRKINGVELKLLFQSYWNLPLYCNTMEEYVQSQYKEEAVIMIQQLYSYQVPEVIAQDNLIAAELDVGGSNLAEVLEDIILSENNVHAVTRSIIRGIIKSDNTHLHKVLGDYLLAARLQEGVRQAVCENMDCGTKEAFLTVLQVIVEHNLLRYSSVKRAVATWTGICDEMNAERISNKVLDLIDSSLTDENYRIELTKSNDSIAFYIGLWAVGFYEVEDAIRIVKEKIRTGTRNQKLTASYYNESLYYEAFAKEGARLMIETYPEDIELCAAYMSTYIRDAYGRTMDALYGENREYYYGVGNKGKYVYGKIPWELYFESKEQAKKHYEILKSLYNKIPKKGYEKVPCIFPWYRVSMKRSDILERMFLIGYSLEEESYKDELCSWISELSTNNRKNWLRLLLHKPSTEIQRNTLLYAIADKESYTRKTAYEIIDEMELTKEDFEELKSLLRYKTEDIRRNVLDLLEKQTEDALYTCIEELVSEKKEEIRTGGLDLIVRQKKKKNKELFEKVSSLALKIEKPSPKEQIIIEELTGKSSVDEILKIKGYGLYNPEVKINLPEIPGDSEYIKQVFEKEQNELEAILKKLDDVIEKHKEVEYTDEYGEVCLLNDRLRVIDFTKSGLERYPMSEVWREFYQAEIKDIKTVLNLRAFIENAIPLYGWNRKEKFNGLAKEIYGGCCCNIALKPYKNNIYIFRDIIYAILTECEQQEENRAEIRKVAKSLMAVFLSKPVEETTCVLDDRGSIFYAKNDERFSFFANYIKRTYPDDAFKESFILCYQINQYYQDNVMNLSFGDYVKAYCLGMISIDSVYAKAFEDGLSKMFQQVQYIVKAVPSDTGMKEFSIEGVSIEENPIFQTSIEIYWNIVDIILQVELKRSELPTIFSNVIKFIKRIRGMEVFVSILAALGNDTLDRSVYYYYSAKSSKKECLSSLLSVSEPLEGEDAVKLKELLKGKNITERRLIEAAMYAPNWIDIIEDYLGWSGLKSGIYYFIAHMNERLDDKKAAIVAKYTPLTKEELSLGAVDLDWFKECNKKLGEKRFQLLYDGAKYISDGNKHTRARKYADAARGNVTVEELEKQIDEKRNKDLLMSYPLIPIQNEKDMIRRYEYIHKFLKESKQFGAQRRASESMAAKMALQNLAVSTGMKDVTRLTLNMETKLVKTLKPYFKWKKIGDIEVKIEITAFGKPEMVCQKENKRLKSIPSKYKKDDIVLEWKEVCKKLKNQYTRTKAMLEQFMEDGTELTRKEIIELKKNPIILPLLKNLVFVCKENIGFFGEKELERWNGEQLECTSKSKLRIAHPYDLWKSGEWVEYQRVLFERGIKQPFKQVFRELYVKTTEELERVNSLRYAGNQIQPKKTIACLKSRRWIADYENGLQKVYYKENIVARIYALADWFSPSDIEAPTLEWVEFSDRKTCKPLKIKEIPDIIFSEVMRDVDLAVSVAHVGGVDPETSHSTIQMRRAIIEFNLTLFGLKNVTFSENHARITGTRANYTIHLGSGMIFKQGGTQIAVLPVHSQHRGKLFLPFIDEDPKTAEIISKIVLFAEDQKIKDPSILEQIVSI